LPADQYNSKYNEHWYRNTLKKVSCTLGVNNSNI
jgi:hypothetical protein